MTTFEDRLLAQLRQVVAARPAPAAPASPPAVARPSRRGRFALAGAGITAVAVAAVLLTSGGAAAPAFAVERQADGDISVTIKSLSDASGLEAKLRDYGITAAVDYVPLGKACREPRGTPARGPSQMGVRIGDGGAATFTIPRGEVKDGQTLVIVASGGEHATSMQTQVVQGAASPCELVDAPAPPPAGAVTGGKGLSRAPEHGSGPSLSTAP